jgi:ribulose-bisphosphate carboxylase large chain
MTRADLVIERAHQAKSLGAPGLLVCPVFVGLHTMRVPADDDPLRLPMIAHPTFVGSDVVSPSSGIGHGLAFGMLQRLASADITDFPSSGGRSSFTRHECREVATVCAASLDTLLRILPAPGGGLTIRSMADATATYGLDAADLIGGGMHRAGPDLEADARACRELLVDQSL